MATVEACPDQAYRHSLLVKVKSLSYTRGSLWIPIRM